jgi:hypothetical protein
MPETLNADVGCTYQESGVEAAPVIPGCFLEWAKQSHSRRLNEETMAALWKNEPKIRVSS